MIGIDAVDVQRLRTVMQRSRGTEERMFTEAERAYCRAMPDPVIHFAGTLAVKEAVIKAAGLRSLPAWSRRIEVHRGHSGAPVVRVDGADVGRFAISISHDGPVAMAVAIATGSSGGSPPGLAGREVRPRPNAQLMRYLSGPVVGA